MTREEEIRQVAEKFAETKLTTTAQQQCLYDFKMGAEWADSHPYWISVEDALPPRSELNEKISEAVITFAYYGDGPHFLVELNRYHYGDGQWLYSNAKYWMPFRFPKKGDEK